MRGIGSSIISNTKPERDEYENFITIGVGSLSSVRLWYSKNGIIEKSRPNFVPLEWRVKERLESTRSIKWYITVGTQKNENKVRIHMEETIYSDLEKLSVSSA